MSILSLPPCLLSYSAASGELYQLPSILTLPSHEHLQQHARALVSSSYYFFAASVLIFSLHILIGKEEIPL